MKVFFGAFLFVSILQPTTALARSLSECAKLSSSYVGLKIPFFDINGNKKESKMNLYLTPSEKAISIWFSHPSDFKLEHSGGSLPAFKNLLVNINTKKETAKIDFSSWSLLPFEDTDVDIHIFGEEAIETLIQKLVQLDVSGLDSAQQLAVQCAPVLLDQYFLRFNIRDHKEAINELPAMIAAKKDEIRRLKALNSDKRSDKDRVIMAEVDLRRLEQSYAYWVKKVPELEARLQSF